MWVVSAFVFLANPLLGAVLLLSAAVTTGLKVAKVDTEYAKHGKTPPSYALVEKWLERRKASGKAPKSAKVAKAGMWSYAWQRWQAMWEDLGEQHREVRDQYKTAVAAAKAKGEVPPPKPTLKETLTGWKWQLDQLTPPTPTSTPTAAAGAEPAAPATPASSPTRKPSPRPQPTTAAPASTGTAGAKWPTYGVCAKCGNRGNLTAVGQCELCLTAGEYGFCSQCHSLMVRDGDVFRHGPNQGCTAVAPAANKAPWPRLAPAPAPTKAGHCKCGQKLIQWGEGENVFPACPVCDGVHRGTPERTNCQKCLQFGYQVQVRPDRGPYLEHKTGKFFIHEMTGAARCPSTEQIRGYEQTRMQDRPGPDTALQKTLSESNRHKANSSQPVATTKSADNCWQCGTSHPPFACPVDAARWEQATGESSTHDQNPEGDPMTQVQSGEVTGIPSAVHYMNQVADTHTQHAGNESVLGAMNTMNIGAGDVALVQQAQEASRNAAELWSTAASTIEQHNAGVREGYASAPDAADKTAQMAE